MGRKEKYPTQRVSVWKKSSDKIVSQSRRIQRAHTANQCVQFKHLSIILLKTSFFFSRTLRGH